MDKNVTLILRIVLAVCIGLTAFLSVKAALNIRTSVKNIKEKGKISLSVFYISAGAGFVIGALGLFLLTLWLYEEPYTYLVKRNYAVGDSVSALERFLSSKAMITGAVLLVLCLVIHLISYILAKHGK